LAPEYQLRGLSQPSFATQLLELDEQAKILIAKVNPSLTVRTPAAGHLAVADVDGAAREQLL
jgi:hypothetical protein